MPLFSRRRGGRTAQPAVDPATAAALLTQAQRAHTRAEDSRDHDPRTLARIETSYSQAAAALHVCGSPAELDAWLGLAAVRRYQKGRRPDTLDAFGRALAFNPFSGAAWDAYLDYFTYAPTAEDLLGAVAGMPPAIRAGRIEWLLAVARQSDRWGTMASAEAAQFLAGLPGELRRLGDPASLGIVLSQDGIRTEREGSLPVALAVLREAASTGHPTPVAADRLTVHLVKAGAWAEAAAVLETALARPIASDTLRERMSRRLTRCRAQLP